jgi:hypothetical protein
MSLLNVKNPVENPLAYEYLIGHARWFGQPPGAALLGFLAGHLRSYRPSPGR